MRHYQRTTNSIEEGFGHLGCVPFACRKMKPRCTLYGNALWRGIRGLLFQGACKNSLTMVGTSHCSCIRYSQIFLRKLLKTGQLSRGQSGMLATVRFFMRFSPIRWSLKMERCLYRGTLDRQRESCIPLMLKG